MRLLSRLLPDLPAYERGGGPTIPQAVILRQGGAGIEVVLVLRTTPRAWELPGGYVERDESAEEALAREVWEETGLRVRLERLVGRYARTGFRPHRSPVYACSVLDGALRASHEAVRAAWFPVDALPLGLFPWYRPIIRDAAGGVSHAEEQRQHLGFAHVWRAALIHVAGTLRLFR
jgi:8-oxo-dGTP pyrophosphatase MutT (NUDIX family)